VLLFNEYLRYQYLSLAVTNGIIFLYARRSSQRVQPMNGDNASSPALCRRDVRLLKHMIFMFVVGYHCTL
jgi:hypothetical protein